MLTQVRQAILRYHMAKPGDRVVVACSGGPDSTALLHLLWLLRSELNVELHVAHLDHRLRGRASRADARAVADFAVSLGLPVTLGSADVAGLARRQGWSTELAARHARYAFLERVAREVEARSVALGHHQNDQAETVLMRVLRGTGVDGLGGMAPVRPLAGVPGGLAIRPLLFSTRDQIEAYCRDNALPTRHDATNDNPDYFRNRLRLDILPGLRRLNPGLDRALTDLADEARADSEWLEEQAASLLQAMSVTGGHVDSGGQPVLELDLDPLRRAPLSLQRRALRQALNRLSRSAMRAAGASYQNVESLRLLALEGEPSGHLDLAFGVTADRRYDRLLLTRPLPNDTHGGGGRRAPIVQAPVSLAVPGSTDLPRLGWRILAEVLPGAPPPQEMVPGDGYLDFDRLPRPLWVRNRRRGDLFRPLGSAESRRLKDFLMDERVPAPDRDRVPLVVAGDELAWVGGIRPADPFRVGESTRSTLHLRLEPLSASDTETNWLSHP
ncbi:MAG: tRNA lysidine(34) synthetase TilS [Bacillota bacterium]